VDKCQVLLKEGGLTEGHKAYLTDQEEEGVPALGQGKYLGSGITVNAMNMQKVLYKELLKRLQEGIRELKPVGRYDSINIWHRKLSPRLSSVMQAAPPCGEDAKTIAKHMIWLAGIRGSMALEDAVAYHQEALLGAANAPGNFTHLGHAARGRASLLFSETEWTEFERHWSGVHNLHPPTP